MVVSGRGCSSRSTTTSGFPRFPGTVTGTSSSANRPASWAAPARCCERSESSSCSSREMPYSRRRFSAGLEHAAGHRVVPAAGRLAGPAEPVHQLDAAGADAGAQPERVVLDLATSTRRRRRRPPGPRRWRPARRRTARPAGRSRSGGRAAGPGRRCRGRRRGRRSARSPATRRWGCSCRARRRRRRPRRGRSDGPARQRRDARSAALREGSAPPKRPTGVRTGSQMTTSFMARR